MITCLNCGNDIFYDQCDDTAYIDDDEDTFCSPECALEAHGHDLHLTCEKCNTEVVIPCSIEGKILCRKCALKSLKIRRLTEDKYDELCPDNGD